MSLQLQKIIADFDTQLATAASVGDTTATLVSATDDDGVALPTGTYGLTIDAGNSSKEYIICTLTGTALTSILNITRQGVTSSGFARTHRRGAKVTITDWGSLKAIQNVIETGYASATTPTTDYQLATKKYVDDASFIGATNASTTTPGVVELPTQAEVDAGTASGGAGPLVVTPDTLRAKKYNDYAADSVGTDSYAITITPAITAYVAGQVFTFKAGTANTGACTLNVSGLGAKTIKKNVSTDLATGDILQNQIVTVVYDGTNFQMMSLKPRTEPVVLTTDVSGVLPIANGGTGLATLNYNSGAVAGATTGTTVIAHGLGKTPAHIKITAIGNSSSTVTLISIGTYNGTNQQCVFSYINSTNSSVDIDTSKIIYYQTGASVYTYGVASIDSTNITITWTSNGGNPSNKLLWEAWGI